jgi:hypothetical protein
VQRLSRIGFTSFWYSIVLVGILTTTGGSGFPAHPATKSINKAVMKIFLTILDLHLPSSTELCWVQVK